MVEDGWVIDERVIAHRHELLSPHLSERELRLWAAVEALSYARGGVAAVSRATGIAPAAIRRAQRELSADGPRATAREARSCSSTPGGTRRRSD